LFTGTIIGLEETLPKMSYTVENDGKNVYFHLYPCSKALTEKDLSELQKKTKAKPKKK
jgi:hypothetical protein